MFKIQTYEKKITFKPDIHLILWQSHENNSPKNLKKNCHSKPRFGMTVDLGIFCFMRLPFISSMFHLYRQILYNVFAKL